MAKMSVLSTRPGEPSFQEDLGTCSLGNFRNYPSRCDSLHFGLIVLLVETIEHVNDLCTEHKIYSTSVHSHSCLIPRYSSLNSRFSKLSRIKSRVSRIDSRVSRVESQVKIYNELVAWLISRGANSSDCSLLVWIFTV